MPALFYDVDLALDIIEFRVVDYRNHLDSEVEPTFRVRGGVNTTERAGTKEFPDVKLLLQVLAAPIQIRINGKDAFDIVWRPDGACFALQPEEALNPFVSFSFRFALEI